MHAQICRKYWRGALLVAVMAGTLAGAPAPVDEPAAIPAPPWAQDERILTSAVQLLEYVLDVLPCVPADTGAAILDALDRHVGEADLQAILYDERIRGEELDDYLLDGAYTNPAVCGLEAPSGNAGDSAWLRLSATASGLQDMIAGFGDQWRVFHHGADTNTMTLGGMLYALSLLNELTDRIAATNDALDHLERYLPVFDCPGAPRALYDAGFRLRWYGQHHRAAKLFTFLLDPRNPDGFARGSSEYWLAVYYWAFAQPRDAERALRHALAVHNHPACLVFIDCAYNLAAEIYARRGQPDLALALFSINVPSASYQSLEYWKAECSLRIACRMNDLTNAVRQLERARKATETPAAIPPLETLVAHKFPGADCAGIAAQLRAAGDTPAAYQFGCLARVMQTLDYRRESELADMLMHDWPGVEEVSPVLITNRLLSNNILPQRRRTDISLP
jgi:tetratricopeptide (TPR) repeat protein